MSRPLTDLANIGQQLAARLHAAGVCGADAFLALGDAQAFAMLKAHSPDDCCFQTRLALAGAARGVRWTQLDADVRARVAAEFSR